MEIPSSRKNDLTVQRKGRIRLDNYRLIVLSYRKNVVNDTPTPSKDAIVTAARKLFARFGLAKTSVEEIAREAGLSKATVYNYFGGKEHIVVGVVEAERRELLAKVTEAVEEAPGPVEAILTFFRTRVKHLQKLHHDYLPREEDMRRAMPHVVRSIEAHRKEEQGLIERILHRGIAEGTFRAHENVPLTAEILFITAVGLTFPFHEKTMKSVGPRLEAFLNMTMRGLCTAEGCRSLATGE